MEQPVMSTFLEQRKYRKEQLTKNPEQFRARCAAISQKHRDKNKKHNRAYMNAYLKKWREDPINNRSHKARTALSSIKLHYKKYGHTNFGDRNKKIFDNLTKIGWSVDIPSNICLNHKCSLVWLFTFNINLPFDICYDVDNIELVSRISNNMVWKRQVTDEVIVVAKILEKKYPEQLKGFGKYMKSKKGLVK